MPRENIANAKKILDEDKNAFKSAPHRALQELVAATEKLADMVEAKPAKTAAKNKK